MEMPALTVLVCLMFWGSVWGIIGAILSVRASNNIFGPYSNFQCFKKLFSLTGALNRSY